MFPTTNGVTDISYIHTKQGVLHLSIIRDLYDNSIVAYKTGNPSDGESGSGHHSSGNAAREKDLLSFVKKKKKTL